MERLTEKRDGQNIIPLRQDGKLKWALCRAGMGDAPTQFLYGAHADKLAEYEDLEERLQAVYGECDGLLEKVIEHLERHENVDIPEPVFKARLLTDGEVDRWEEYKTLDKQEKLLKTPCAVGDMTYNVNKSFGWIVDAVVKRIEIDTDGFWVITSAGTHSFDDFGKTVFLDKEEAEAALNETLAEVKHEDRIN